jgi:hypothetical protein
MVINLRVANPATLHYEIIISVDGKNKNKKTVSQSVL